MGALDGQHVLVTGGASGIGKACAARYRAEGATVYVADLHPRSSDEIQLDPDQVASRRLLPGIEASQKQQVLHQRRHPE